MVAAPDVLLDMIRAALEDGVLANDLVEVVMVADAELNGDAPSHKVCEPPLPLYFYIS